MAGAGGLGAADEAAFRDIRVGTYPYAVVFILMLMTALSFMDRTILSLLIDPLKAAFRLDETQMGLLAGFTFALFYAVMGIPLARIADLGNRRNLIILGVAGWSLATAACGLARGFGSLFAARAFVGIGEAALAPAAFSLIASYFPRPRIGLAMSLFAVGVTLGNGAAVTLGGLIVQWSRSHSVGRLAAIGDIDGWRLAFMVVACLGVPAVLLMLGVREPARQARPGAARAASLAEVVAYIGANRGAFFGVYAGYPLVVVMSFAQLIWGPTYFMRIQGYSPAAFGLIYGLVIGVGGTASLVLGGMWSDFLWKRGRFDSAMRIILFSVIVQAPLLIAAFLLHDRLLSIAMFSAGVIALCLNGGLLGATLQVLSPEPMRGRIFAFYVILANVVGAGLGPWITGMMTQYLFGGPMGLGCSLATLAAVTLPAAAVILSLALGPVRQTAQRLRDATALDQSSISY